MIKRTWKEDEIEYLMENIGQVKVSTLARNLNRSEQALLNKMKRLGISNTRIQSGYLTTHQLASLLNVDPATVRRWINNHGLKSLSKVTRLKKKFSFILPEDFWEWAKVNREKINLSKVKPQTILPEPEWFEEERKNEKPIVYKIWSKKEEITLLMMMSNGDSIKDVAMKLKRSNISIVRKYKRLQNSVTACRKQ